MSLVDANVLDLFSGTGALGLEAISRGAVSATFVEMDGRVMKYAHKNAANLGVADHCSFLRGDVIAYVRRYAGPPFDVILVDPPYGFEGIGALPDIILPILKADGYLVFEHGKNTRFDDHPLCETSRNYGRAVVSLFRKEDPEIS